MDVHLLFRAWLGIQWYEHDQMVLPHEIMQIDQIFASIFHGEYNGGLKAMWQSGDVGLETEKGMWGSSHREGDTGEEI